MSDLETDLNAVLILAYNNSEPVHSDAITSTIKNTGRYYVTKLFRSRPENWRIIVDIIRHSKEERIQQVLCQLNENLFLDACNDDYRELFKEVIFALRSVPHILFVYHDILEGKYNWLQAEHWGGRTYLEHYCERTKYPGGLDAAIACLNELSNFLIDSGVNLVPYRNRGELTATAQAFLLEHGSDLVLRLYVPNQRIWGNELDRLLNLFQEYLNRVAGFSVSLRQTRTQHGIAYSFFSNDQSYSSETLETSLQDFSGFLNVCAQDPEKAMTLLRQTQAKESTIREIVTRYSREARRLALDLQFERDSKLLSIQHRLRSELLDAESYEKYLGSGEENTVSFVPVVNHGPAIEGITSILSPNMLGGQVTVNINNPQFISIAKGIVAQEINGEIVYNEYDERILEVVRNVIEQLSGGASDESWLNGC